jgi:hypothetical protein
MTANRWATEPILPTVGVLGRPQIRLFLTSAVVLFVELLLIRWIPANVTFLGFFRNFLLMASFLGIGAGILFGRDERRLPISLAGLVLLAMTVLVANQTLQVNFPDTKGYDLGFVVLALIVMLTSIVMATISLPLGSLLAAMPPLRAYATDIAGSMTGIAAFSVLSALQTGPALWFAIVAGVLGVLALGTGVTRWSIVSGLFLVATVVVSVVQQPPGTSWSPYYRVSEQQAGDILGISVNGIPHQALWPANDPRKERFYDQIYRWFPDRRFDRVLIVGAGSGTDTAIALAHNAGHIDAVEIDPLLQDIGVRKHPDRPYADPRVYRTIDDGRAFLSRHTERFDLVVFALPDSLTLISTSANVRLESFLFTTEAFSAVRNHLNDGGIFVLYNYYRDSGLVTKLDEMLRASFGGKVLVRRYPGLGSSAAALAAGPGVDDLNGASPPGDSVDVVGSPGGIRLATDDWPFLYLMEPGIPGQYLVALAFILAWAVLLVVRGARRGGIPLTRFSPHFFVLGIAFLLLETRSIVTFSLLFGSTWLVNALVFFAVLASVLLAILVASRVRVRQTWWLYAGLLGSLGLAFVLPPASLLIEPLWLRYVLATALAFAPVFFANLVFSFSFRDTRTADMAFASNLLGAMVGGALEYAALITGYQALVLVVGGLYAAAFVLATRVRQLADVDLTNAPRQDMVGD